MGLGFQEMIYNYLGSERDYIERMNLDTEGFIEIANPMTESYAYVRKSIIPDLLGSESVSANAVYPHRIFEIGKVAYQSPGEKYAAKTRTYMGFLAADRESGFNDVNSHVSALFYYLARELTLEDARDPRFVPGRTAEIFYRGTRIGIMGEVHPEVLTNWGIQMPCACGEIDLESLLEPSPGGPAAD